MADKKIEVQDTAESTELIEKYLLEALDKLSEDGGKGVLQCSYWSDYYEGRIVIKVFEPRKQEEVE